MLATSRLSECQSRMEIVFAGELAVLDACGALYLPEHDLLAVTDLHLEKGSFFAARGNPVPRHDTHDTLLRLTAAIEHYRPEAVVCLGDSFHDAGAGERMMLPDAAMLKKLMARPAAWIWLIGNHDPQIPAHFSGTTAALHQAGPLRLAHMPETPAPPLIAGHYHPKLSVSIARQRDFRPMLPVQRRAAADAGFRRIRGRAGRARSGARPAIPPCRQTARAQLSR